MWSSLRRAIRRPTTRTLLDSRHGASRAAEGDFGQCQLLPGLVFSAAIPIRLPIALIVTGRRCAPIVGFFLSARMALGKWLKSLASRADQSKHPAEPLRLKEIHSEMEQAKLANGSVHRSIGHSSTAAPKKAPRKKAESARPLRKATGTKSKSEKLVCRYCGSDDLAPSFIERRDRRCRKCFSKRYGSAAPARKAKIKK